MNIYLQIVDKERQISLNLQDPNNEQLYTALHGSFKYMGVDINPILKESKVREAYAETVGATTKDTEEWAPPSLPGIKKLPPMTEVLKKNIAAAKRAEKTARDQPKNTVHINPTDPTWGQEKFLLTVCCPECQSEYEYVIKKKYGVHCCRTCNVPLHIEEEGACTQYNGTEYVANKRRE